MKNVSAFVLWWSRANLSIILWSYQANFSSLASSYTRILQHQGSKLRKPGWETGRYPYASCQSWRKRNWHTPWDLLGCTYFDSIWACVSQAAACHDNHQVGFAQRHLLFCLVMLQNESFNFQKMFGLCLFPYSQHICSTLTQMDCLITVCISRRLNVCVVKSRMFSSSSRTLTSHPPMLTNTSFIVEGSLHELLFHALKHLLKVWQMTHMTHVFKKYPRARAGKTNNLF